MKAYNIPVVIKRISQGCAKVEMTKNCELSGRLIDKGGVFSVSLVHLKRVKQAVWEELKEE